jgi:hypothetical protein
MRERDKVYNIIVKRIRGKQGRTRREEEKEMKRDRWSGRREEEGRGRKKLIG